MAEKDARQKRYTEEFKLQAAKLIVEGGYTFSKALPATGG
jgi:transposase-like protein